VKITKVSKFIRCWQWSCKYCSKFDQF